MPALLVRALLAVVLMQVSGLGQRLGGDCCFTDSGRCGDEEEQLLTRLFGQPIRAAVGVPATLGAKEQVRSASDSVSSSSQTSSWNEWPPPGDQGIWRCRFAGGGSLKTWIVTLVLLAAAILEVGGDAVVRVGLRGHRGFVIALGFIVLGAYGIVVNLLPLDFGRLLGAYVGFFAVVSVIFGRFVFGEAVLSSTWLGLALILAGSFVIQRGFR